ncbi:biotin carboxylase N-terminal domain-containing protein [Phreatobacter sp.]|uniref:acetyl/propionyl/methylcrotonyl-CoA carboxylase subunit alpha n=1 Tax=Phreatobacter sp. TaxID=1966341 RepID=UPI0022C5C352|nr:biotin carboxylase N-terminal domain-containing protein [Phreatobacter sp.]MCZ8316083.1 ATP-grasp domain-containing protein [Phreatobacter sp.]
MTVIPLKPPGVVATPFRRLLVANRGEIALRIFATAREMGLETVAVYSSADARSRHVHAADRSVAIGGPLPAESYLNIPAIIAAAKAAGAEAIHPGYGFLAENAGFARACREAGIVFVGPSPDSIEAMGDKARAKALMQAAGVPVVPGYQGDDQSDARLAAEAAAIGYPVMIKAVAGGGGRGMRLVREASQFAEALRSARSEAANAFGDGTVLLEKAIESPRHIEIQVFGDRHGNAWHMGERDCSIQRRHQKLIEEAPSPAVSHELRQRMGEVAVKAVKSLGYEGAGTLEFLLDREGNFYFMEMNTRLQVEHRVSELNVGRDFVEWQLRIAAGEAIAPHDAHAPAFGHTIEVRLCAEDPAQDFLPQSGRFHTWPECIEPYAQIDTAMAVGAEVPPYYDSMVAKVFVHESTREEARAKLMAWLNGFASLGIMTNQGFLARALAHPVFAEGRATTAFIADHGADLARPVPQGLPDAVLAAAVLHDDETPDRYRYRPRHLGPPLPIPMVIEIDGRRHDVVVQQERDGTCRLSHGGVDYVIRFDEGRPDFRKETPRCRFIHDGVADEIPCWREGDRLFLQRGPDQVIVRDLTRAPAQRAGAEGSDGRVLAAMNGRVVAVHVAAGDEVAAGQPVVTLEAMKMEHVHMAGAPGTVGEIGVVVGEQVTTGRLLAAITPTAP